MLLRIVPVVELNDLLRGLRSGHGFLQPVGLGGCGVRVAGGGAEEQGEEERGFHDGKEYIVFTSLKLMFLGS